MTPCDQIRPFWIKNGDTVVYGLRRRGRYGGLWERPKFQGCFYFNGIDSHYIWDKVGRYKRPMARKELRVLK
jgi:hypothetical protein